MLTNYPYGVDLLKEDVEIKAPAVEISPGNFDCVGEISSVHQFQLNSHENQSGPQLLRNNSKSSTSSKILSDFKQKVKAPKISQALSQASSGKTPIHQQQQKSSNVYYKGEVQTPVKQKYFKGLNDLSPIPEVEGQASANQTISKRLQRLQIQSSIKKSVSEVGTPRKAQVNITPLVQNLAKLRLQSSKRKSSQQYVYLQDEPCILMTPRRLNLSISSKSQEQSEKQKSSLINEVLPQNFNAHTKSQLPVDSKPQKPGVVSQEFKYLSIEDTQRMLNSNLGDYGLKARELSIVKQEVKKQQYSLSFVAAISKNKLITSQFIEGAFDSVLFENFIYQTLRFVRTDKDMANKKVILLMDNAVIHKYSWVLETCRNFKVNVLFNAEYSPWLNPIEQLFGHIKKNLKNVSVNSKAQLVREVSGILKSMSTRDFQKLWAFSLKKWVHTLKYGHV